MTHEEPTIIPLADLPVGWEPIADFGEDLPEAIRFYESQRELETKVCIVIDWNGSHSVWSERWPDWPMPRQ